jgi:hypothetical protein
MNRDIVLSSMITVTPDHVSADLAGEAVILNLKSGVYYGLDAVGAQIWELLKQPCRVSHIRDRILEEYEVEPEQCQNDLLSLLHSLVEEGLIEVKNGSDA